MVHAGRTSLAATLVGLGLIASALVGACSSGNAFEANASAGAGGGQSDAGSTAGSGVGGSGMVVMPPSGTKACTGPADCDDVNPCTIDECGAEGKCEYKGKCEDEGLLCCDGDCGSCCVQQDCDDGVSCTVDQCFDLFCVYTPDDGLCTMEQYCNGLDGCKQREPCPNGNAAECDDGNPCTEDSCDAGLCDHAFCSGGESCCEGVGCATCCSDAQCQDDELCTKEVCQDGRCQSGPLCAGTTERCCEGADNATCGACCEQSDCDDGVSCTLDGCSGGICSNEAVDTNCNDDEICDPEAGCVPVGMCNSPADCVSADPCQTGACVDGHCAFTGCAGNLQCCPGVGCRACCDNTQCAGLLCCDGVCQECCTQYDCGVVTNPTTQAAIPLGCEHTQCILGMCQTTYEMCDFGYCCAPNGCMLDLCY